MKKIFITIFSLFIALAFMPTFKSDAASDNATWVDEGNCIWTLSDDEGTDITVKLVDNVLHVQGTGAIPSYSADCLGNKPWHQYNSSVHEILVYNGITSIGSRAFSNMPYLTKVTMYATTFLEDGTVFANAPSDCIFTFLGTNMSEKLIGDKIPYTSLDSIVQFALDNNNGEHYFNFANTYMARLVKQKSGNRLLNVVGSDPYDETTNVNYPYIDLSSSIAKVSGTLPDPVSLTIKSSNQGMAALEIFALVIGDNEYVGAYNVSVNSNGTVVKQTDEPVTYSMEIPAAYRYPGRQFSLIQLGSGVVNILADEDMDDNTITFTTDYPSTVYALVYHD